MTEGWPSSLLKPGRGGCTGAATSQSASVPSREAWADGTEQGVCLQAAPPRAARRGRAGCDILRASDRAWGTRVPRGQERGLLRREGFGAGSVFFQSPPQRSLLMLGTAFLLARGGGETPSPCESVPGEVCPPCSGSTVPSSPCQRDVRCLEELVLQDRTLPGQAAQQEGATLGGPRHGVPCRGEPDGKRCPAELPPTALPSRSRSCEGSSVGGAGAEGGLFCVPLAPCCWGDTRPRTCVSCPPCACSRSSIVAPQRRRNRRLLRAGKHSGAGERPVLCAPWCRAGSPGALRSRCCLWARLPGTMPAACAAGQTQPCTVLGSCWPGTPVTALCVSGPGLP